MQPALAVRRGPALAPGRDRGRDRHGDVPVEHLQHQLRVARLQRGEQLAVLVDHRAEALAAAVAEEVGPDPRPDRAPDLNGVGLPGARDDDVVEPEVGLDELEQVVRLRRLLHQPDLLAELGVVLVGHPVEGVQEAVALEREADRDQHLLHLFVRDAEHDGATVGDRHHEALVLELAQRLAHRAPARAELARQRRLDQALARLEPAGDDLAAEDLHDLLTAGAALARAAVDDDCRCAFVTHEGRSPSSVIVDNNRIVDNRATRA